MAYNYSFLHHNSHTPVNRSSRRAPPRLSSSLREVRSMKELTESTSVAAFRARFEAGRSFDLDDDLEFCPDLLTEEEIQSISAASSDRSSNASSSPESSPMQHQIQPSSFSLTNPYGPYTYNQNVYIKPQQSPPTVTTRVRNAIPIVNPTTGLRVASPPLASSPSRQPHANPVARRMQW
jgi:hypothetical protein